MVYVLTFSFFDINFFCRCMTMDKTKMITELEKNTIVLTLFL